MAQGGKRPGAGRPVGAATKRTREIADRAAAEGALPLDVMLRAMREHADAERWDDAAKIAALAAPYLHPRLATIDHQGKVNGELALIVQTGVPRSAIAGPTVKGS